MSKKKSIAILLLFMFTAPGCVSYKYLQGVKPYGDDYVVSRNDTLIPEYTIGRDKKAPLDSSSAEERFKRRRAKVEYYYKKMDIFYDPLVSFASYPLSLVSMITGIFKLPFIAVSDYRYEHNPEYRKRIDKLEADKKRKEDEQRQKLQDELNAFIKRDLEIERELDVNIKQQK